MNLDEFINGDDFINAISPLKDEIVDNRSIPLVAYFISHSIKYYLMFKDTNYTNDDLYNYINFLSNKYESFRNKDYDYINYTIEGRPSIRAYDDFLILKNVLHNYGLSYKDLNDNDNRKKVYDYLNNYMNNTYMFHAFNSASEESIIKYGISPNIRLNSNEEVVEINNLFKKYGEYGILNDFENSSMGSFYYSKDPIVSYRYGLKSPEWFYMFCGGSRAYTQDEVYDEEAYINRDYDASLNNINTKMDKLSFSKEDKDKVTNFFNKYWNYFNEYEPRLLILPDIYARRDDELEEDDYEINPIEFTDETINLYVNEIDTNTSYPVDMDIKDGILIGLPTHKEVIEKIHGKTLKK